MTHCENNIVKDHGNKKAVQMLTDMAETISACGKDIGKVAENIMVSCRIPGTRGAAYRNQLLAKAGDLKRLVALYSSASQRLVNTAGKLAKGVPEDEVWADVLV